MTMADFALRWILDHDAVSCIIPGARNARQVSENVKASALAPLSANVNSAVEQIYNDSIKPLVHDRW
jgi:aryl-alcohol dehydrogenase-like predicted oxidoreductase